MPVSIALQHRHYCSGTIGSPDNLRKAPDKMQKTTRKPIIVSFFWILIFPGALHRHCNNTIYFTINVITSQYTGLFQKTLSSQTQQRAFDLAAFLRFFTAIIQPENN
jgi:hypothetical protein